ncbi:MAG: hypothetical protein AAFR87_28060 [Bacteroidota bacterium]
MDTKFQFGVFLLAILIAACTTDKVVPDNPFEGFKETVSLEANNDTELESGSFAQLHRDIFAPTYANSGCHDGQFEPDFRKIESTYNTLVYHPVLKNNPSAGFEYRVVPFESTNSVLWERLNNDIDGQSGIMPLAVDPDSDWEERKDEYLHMIRTWIENGAPDIFGNIAEEGNIKPYLLGMQAYADNGSSLSRDGGNGSILIPTDIEDLGIWFSMQDDGADSRQIRGKLYLSYEVDDFREIDGHNLITSAQIVGAGFEGEDVLFSHQSFIELDSFDKGKVVYLHLRIIDPESGKFLWIPGVDSPDYIKEIFSFKRF